MQQPSRTIRAWLLYCLVGPLVGCQGNVTDKYAAPCDRPDPPAACNQPCSLDSDCADGFHCGPLGRCTAECTPSGGQCVAGKICNALGRCGNPGDGGVDAPNCPDVTVKLGPRTPDVLLLIDQSASMAEDFGQIADVTVSRWEAVAHALIDPSLGVVSQLQDKVRFGGILYYSPSAGSICPLLTPSLGDPPGRPQLQNREAIASLLQDNHPAVTTPTPEAIDEAVADILKWREEQDAPSPWVLLLATDGDPNTCEDVDTHDELARQKSEAAVQQAFAAGILTYVLSVGSEVTASHLQRLANAGVGKPLEPADAPFFRGNDPAELATAFQEVMGGVQSCTLTLDAQVDPHYEQSGTVLLDGVPLEQGKDWQLVDATTVVLLGETCQKMMADESSGELEASFPCGAIIE